MDLDGAPDAGMKHHMIGSMLVKLDWSNRPLNVGLLLSIDHGGASLRVLYPSGPAWEYCHDMFALDDERIRWPRGPEDTKRGEWSIYRSG